QATIAHFGRVDVLVNNAATAGGGGRIATLEEADWDRVIANNLKSVYLCTRAVVPHMVAQSPGAIVNVSSSLAVAPFPGTVAYSTAKAGLLGFPRAVALDLAPHGIRVNLLVPGSVDTDMMGWAEAPVDQVARLRAEVDASIPRGRIGAPEE